MKKMFLAAALSLVLSGCCGSELVGKLPAIVGDDFATVHIARPSRLYGCMMRTTLRLDYEDFYELACGDHVVFKIPAPRKIDVTAQTGAFLDNVYLESDKGGEYFLEDDCSMGTCYLKRVSASSFSKLEKRCGVTTALEADH